MAHARSLGLARVSTATTGTGTITLGSAVSGFQTFAGAGAVDGGVYFYGIKDGTASELGYGTYTSSGTTLSRTVLQSTNSDNPINLSGTAEVFSTISHTSFETAVNAQTGTSYTVLVTDFGKLVAHSNASSISVTLPQATGLFSSGWYYYTRNLGAGTVTITPTTSTIDGASSMVLPQGSSAIIFSDGSNYQTVGGGYLPLAGGTMTGAILNALGAVGTPSISFTGDTNTGIWSPGADTVAISTGGSERLRIGATGNLGIGNTNPFYLLDVGKASGSPVFRLYTDTGSVQAYMQAIDSGAVVFGSLSNTDILFYSNSALRGFFDTSGNFGFNSGYGSAATAYGCRAWVNFNGTGTVAIRASGNVSSITDNGTGDYTVNFTNAMPDANYTLVATGEGSTGAPTTNVGCVGKRAGVAFTTTAARIICGDIGVGGTQPRDADTVCVAVFR